MIHPYCDEDAILLAPIHTAVFPHNPLSPRAFGSYVSTMLAYGAKAWVAAEDVPLGYALAVPVPGLPHIVDLKGCIAPAWQRQGFGGELLRRVLSDMQQTAVQQVSCQVRTLDNPAARFLRKHGFYVEHEEWQMMRADLRHLPQPVEKDGVNIVTQRRAEAVRHFHHLFSASFAGLPWDQPYSPQEIDTALDSAVDILFLALDSKPIGFAWLHLQASGLGMVEPLGVLPEYQQQGYGRFLLLSALHELARRGAARAQIGAWRANQTAIHLYQSLGFTHHETITFLAYDLAK
mgnify:FL=1